MIHPSASHRSVSLAPHEDLKIIFPAAHATLYKYRH